MYLSKINLTIVVSQTRAENQMETCGVHLDGTLFFLPVQGRTPRVPVKAAKGSHAKHRLALLYSRSKQATEAGVAVIFA